MMDLIIEANGVHGKEIISTLPLKYEIKQWKAAAYTGMSSELRSVLEADALHIV
jgi:hypothetical protein